MGHFLKIQNDKIISCSMYDDYKTFPQGQKLIKAKLDDGTFKYLLIDEYFSPFDSGFRCLSKNKTYQIDMSYVYKIFDVKFANANYYINLYNIQHAVNALNNLFDSRVTKDGNDIILIAPRKNLGITKMLMIGLNISISYIDSVDDEVDNVFEFSTYANGSCNYMFNDINRNKMKAMLIKFDPTRKYKIHFEDSYHNMSYNENIKNCLFFGEDIERLPNVNNTYYNLMHITNFFTTNPFTFQFDSASIANSYSNKEILFIKDQYARYSNNKYVYNYYDLNDIKIF